MFRLLILAVILMRRLGLFQSLPNPVSLLGSFVTSFTNYLQQRATDKSIAGLQDQVNALTQSWVNSVNGTQFVFDQVHGAWLYSYNLAQQIGGAVRVIGYNQHELWHHLRYVLMPNTIQYIWDFVLKAWILPLRQHLGTLTYWTSGWLTALAHYADMVRDWTREWQVSGRNWRARYVYPQLQWLLTPARLAYWYTPALLTEIVAYLAYPGHTEDRDGITRMVLSNSPRLWRYVDQAAVNFLETTIDAGGYGSNYAQRPSWATEPMPEIPPQWEPWIADIGHMTQPSKLPGIPEQDYNYNH